MPIRRNPVVRAGAILRKGGVHRQSTSGLRHQNKRQLDNEIDDWLAEQDREQDSSVADHHALQPMPENKNAKGVDDHPCDEIELIVLNTLHRNAPTLHTS